MVKQNTSRLRRLVARLIRKADAPIAPEARVMFANVNNDVIGEGVVSTGTTLLAAAEQLGVDLDHFCGGQSACGTCRIKVQSGARHLSDQSSREALVLGPQAVSAGDRLACQARVLGRVEVTVPRWF